VDDGGALDRVGASATGEPHAVSEAASGSARAVCIADLVILDLVTDWLISDEVALYPRWVNLFFLDSGASLPDPHGLLKGSGKIVRGLRLESAADLDKPAVRSLIAEALARSETPMDRTHRNKLVIRAVSARQRPRRPR
jgi:hypothetical protein